MVYGRLGSNQQTKVEPKAPALVALLQYSLIPLKVRGTAVADCGLGVRSGITVRSLRYCLPVPVRDPVRPEHLLDVVVNWPSVRPAR